MSFLDDLKKEAEQRKSQNEESIARKEDSLAFFHNEVQPRINQLHHFLTELAEQLNFVKPEILCKYTVEGYGEIKNLQQQDYFLSVDDIKETKQLTFSFACVSEENHPFYKENEGTVQKVKDYLWSHSLRFDYQESRNAKFGLHRGNFTLHGRVPIAIIFDVSNEGLVSMSCKNFEILGIIKYSFQATDINDELLDNLAKMIARESNPFSNHIGKFQVTDIAKKTLRQQLERENIQREKELATLIKQREIEEQEKNNKGIGRIMNVFNRSKKDNL